MDKFSESCTQMDEYERNYRNRRSRLQDYKKDNEVADEKAAKLRKEVIKLEKEVDKRSYYLLYFYSPVIRLDTPSIRVYKYCLTLISCTLYCNLRARTMFLLTR